MTMVEFLRFQASMSHVKEDEWSVTGNKRGEEKIKKTEIDPVRIKDWLAAKV